ncbi:MAG: segregation/condensation protein A, partial [Verrucomicrobia bacterium]|nr:segregation/condensation protein A [Verrucomicrobiota bacterium]
MKEALVPNNDLAVRLPAFEGPLDLLLYLIRRNEVDIYDIPIVTVTQQYIDILGSMDELDLEVAGEFFVMAATLMYIKSRLLLPKKDQGTNEDVEDESIDPRWELVQQLLEYKKFKEAAAEIETLILN